MADYAAIEAFRVQLRDSQVADKARSEVMRRVLRAVFEDRDPGDLSALANPEAVDALRRQLAAR